MVFLFIIEKQTLLASSQLGHQKVSKTNANCVNFPLQKRKLSASWKSHNALTAQQTILFLDQHLQSGKQLGQRTGNGHF